MKLLELIVLLFLHNIVQVGIEELKSFVKKEVIDKIFKNLVDSKTKVFINETGRFVLGGPKG